MLCPPLQRREAGLHRFGAPAWPADDQDMRRVVGLRLPQMLHGIENAIMAFARFDGADHQQGLRALRARDRRAPLLADTAAGVGRIDGTAQRHDGHFNGIAPRDLVGGKPSVEVRCDLVRDANGPIRQAADHAYPFCEIAPCAAGKPVRVLERQQIIDDDIDRRARATPARQLPLMPRQTMRGEVQPQEYVPGAGMDQRRIGQW